MATESQFNSKNDDYVAIIELAESIGVRKQTLFKVVKRLGIIPLERREALRGNQLIKVVSLEEATAIKDALTSPQKAEDGNDLPEAVGVFYLIQLEPEHDKGRFKVGFTTDLQDRLRKHRCSAPLLKCLKTWPCQMTWERTAIDCVTNGCEKLHTEVFRTDLIDEALLRADQFFSLMPSPKRK